MQQRISTAEVQQAERLEFWRSWVAGEFHPVAIDNCTDKDFWAECELNSVADVSLARFRGARQTFTRSQSMIRSFNSDHFVVAVTELAPSLFEQNGRNIHCRNGDVLLFDAGRPYTIVHDCDASVTSMLIPRDRLKAVLGATDAASGLVLDGRSASAQLIGGFVRNLAALSPDLDGETARRFSSIGIELVGVGFGERLTAGDVARRRPGSVIVRARTLIEERLQDADLDAAQVAHAMGMSRRRLYEIFEAEDLSIGELIWERRLLRAAQMLAGDHKKPIAEIAFSTGFSSPAHFSRRFRSRFDQSPAEHRAKHLQGA